VLDQEAVKLKLLTEEAIPLLEVQKAVLSDRGTKLMSILMFNTCKKMGI